MFVAYSAVDYLFQIYSLMLFARILCSWVPELQQYKAVQFISFYTDPYLNLFRRFIPPLGMIDISPIFAFLGLNVIKFVLQRAIFLL